MILLLGKEVVLKRFTLWRHLLVWGLWLSTFWVFWNQKWPECYSNLLASIKVLQFCAKVQNHTHFFIFLLPIARLSWYFLKVVLSNSISWFLRCCTSFFSMTVTLKELEYTLRWWAFKVKHTASICMTDNCIKNARKSTNTMNVVERSNLMTWVSWGDTKQTARC